MSFDLNLSSVCNHRVIRELATVDKDLRAIRVSAPIASAATVKVYASEVELSPVDYIIVEDPEAMSSDLMRMILLNKSWRSLEDFFEVTYMTVRGYCQKCLGLDYVTDISYDVLGQVSRVRDESLLLQNVEKFVITEIGSNRFHTKIGTSIKQLVGSKLTNLGYLTTKITQEISATLNMLKDLQSQYKSTGRPITDGELLATVNDVLVSLDPRDSSIIRVSIVVQYVSGKNSLKFTQSWKLK